MLLGATGRKLGAGKLGTKLVRTDRIRLGYI